MRGSDPVGQRQLHPEQGEQPAGAALQPQAEALADATLDLLNKPESWEALRKQGRAFVENERNWSQQPPTRSAHLIGNIAIEGLDAAGCLIVHSTFQLTEWRLQQRQLAGSMQHKLVATEDGGWKIMLKRVNLVNCDAVFENLEVFI